MGKKENESRQKLSQMTIPFDLQQYFAVRPTYYPCWSLDDRRIAFITGFERKFNVFTVPVEGGWPHQVTFDGGFKLGVRWAFDDTLVFMMDNDGDENWQLWFCQEAGSQPWNLTNETKAQHNFGCFSEDRRLFAFSNNARDVHYFDCYIHNFDTKKTRKIIERNIICTDTPAMFSKDKTKLLVEKFFNNMDQDIILLDLETGKETNLTGSEDDVDDVLFTAAKFVDDDTWVYCLSDKDREFRNIARIDPTTRELTWEVEMDHDIETLNFSKDGRYMVYTVNRDGNITPVIHDRKTGQDLDFPWRDGLYTALSFNHSGTQCAFQYIGPTRPSDNYVADLATRSIHQITHSFVGGLREKDLVAPQSIRYTSFDDLEVHAWLYLPHGAKQDGTLPVILYPHGGPEAQVFNTFSFEFQYLVKRGYIVLVPHFRGSMGFGKSFQKKIYKDWGGGDLQDMLYGVNYLIDQKWCDPDRVSVYGASYGGFATLTCLTQAPDVFRCGVDVFGPSNLFTFYESNPPNWRPFVDAVLGNPTDNKAMFEERSPIFHADNIKAPLLIMQGKNDPRVVPEESEQIYQLLKKKGLDVEYVLFEDEGHGFTKKENKLKSLLIMLDFLDKHLKK